MSHYHFYASMRILKSGFLNMFRNLWLTIAATAVMLVALFIIALGVIVNITTSNAIEVLSKELKTTIILKEGFTQEDQANMTSRIEEFEFVDSVTFVTPEEAQQRLIEDPTIGGEIKQATELFEGASFLKPSYEIGLNDLSRASELSVLAEEPTTAPLIERIAFGKTDTGESAAKTDAEKAIDRAAAVDRFVTIGSIASASFLAAVSIMIIFNTIRMAIYTRRSEISIMKLIGATPNYIRGPFLVEASLYGVVAGSLASIAVITLINSVGSKVGDSAEFSQTYNLLSAPSTTIMIILSLILLGILIGVISSSLAMEKHLKLKHW